jgi:SAM-dependent methyltransferase
MNKLPLWMRVRRRGQKEALKLHDLAMDALLGIDAYGAQQPLAPNARNGPYEPISYAALSRVSRALALKPSDLIYDIGCGMGRAICYFARQNIKGSIGVELDPDLASVAKRNIARMRGRRAFAQAHTADAADHGYADATAVFLYNPFGAEVMRAVLDRIDRDRQGRAIRFVYVNPQQAEILDATPWLKRAGKQFRIPLYRHLVPVLMWESC